MGSPKTIEEKDSVMAQKPGYRAKIGDGTQNDGDWVLPLRRKTFLRYERSRSVSEIFLLFLYGWIEYASFQSKPFTGFDNPPACQMKNLFDFFMKLSWKSRYYRHNIQNKLNLADDLH